MEGFAQLADVEERVGCAERSEAHLSRSMRFVSLTASYALLGYWRKNQGQEDATEPESKRPLPTAPTPPDREESINSSKETKRK